MKMKFYFILMCLFVAGLAECQEQLWKDLHGKAEKLFQEKKYPEAIEMTKKSLEVAEKIPDDTVPEYDTTRTVCTVNSLVLLAEIYFELKRYKDAIPLYERIIKLSQCDGWERVSFYPMLAKLYFKLKDYKKAEELYLKGLAVYDNHDKMSILNKAFLSGLAELYKETEEYPKAETCYKRIIEIDKNFKAGDIFIAEDVIRLAVIYLRQNKDEEALKQAEYASSLAPDDAEIQEKCRIIKGITEPLLNRKKKNAPDNPQSKPATVGGDRLDSGTLKN